MQLSLARRRGDLAGVIEQAGFLASPVSGPSDEDIALGSDLRAVALMNLGTAEAWTLGQPDALGAERHLRKGAHLALAGTLVWTGEFDEAERWLQRTRQALQTDTGPAALLEALPRHQTAHAALLADILDVLHGASPPAPQQPGSAPAEELSPGELRVLRYLPTNLSRPEIAGQLSVSPNTVNAHIRSIYAKLQVSDRSAAVRRARELRLLAAGRAR